MKKRTPNHSADSKLHERSVIKKNSKNKRTFASMFDPKEAKKNLQIREEQEKEQRESKRISLLHLTTETLKNMFSSIEVEVYLVGSITQPYAFYSHSDIDIVLKNFTGDRFEIWTKLEALIRRPVEIILFEQCPFQQHVLSHGYKVL